MDNLRTIVPRYDCYGKNIVTIDINSDGKLGDELNVQLNEIKFTNGKYQLGVKGKLTFGGPTSKVQEDANLDIECKNYKECVDIGVCYFNNYKKIFGDSLPNTISTVTFNELFSGTTKQFLRSLSNNPSTDSENFVTTFKCCKDKSENNAESTRKYCFGDKQFASTNEFIGYTFMYYIPFFMQVI